MTKSNTGENGEGMQFDHLKHIQIVNSRHVAFAWVLEMLSDGWRCYQMGLLQLSNPI